MQKITIEVDNEIAQAYREADTDKQQKISMFINVMLKKAINPKPLLEVMEEASKQAIGNGITPEILESILHDKD